MTYKEMAVEALQKARNLLLRHFENEGGRGVELADAIDHTGAAITSLGYEPEN